MTFVVCDAISASPRIEGASKPEWLDGTEAASEQSAHDRSPRRRIEEELAHSCFAADASPTADEGSLWRLRERVS